MDVANIAFIPEKLIHPGLRSPGIGVIPNWLHALTIAFWSAFKFPLFHLSHSNFDHFKVSMSVSLPVARFLSSVIHCFLFIFTLCHVNPVARAVLVFVLVSYARLFLSLACT